MSTLELESMTAEEVGEWLKKKGISEDVVDAFAGAYATCRLQPVAN